MIQPAKIEFLPSATFRRLVGSCFPCGVRFGAHFVRSHFQTIEQVRAATRLARSITFHSDDADGSYFTQESSLKPEFCYDWRTLFKLLI